MRHLEKLGEVGEEGWPVPEEAWTRLPSPKDKRQKRQKDKKTKKTKNKKTKKRRQKKRKDEKTKKTKRQRPKREYDIATSGQFRTLAMF